MWLNQWGCGTGNIIFSHGASDSRGVLIAFREGLNIEIRTCICDKNGRYIILHAHIQDNLILLVNYYAAHDESTHFYRIREEGGSGQPSPPPPPTVHLRTDDVT